MTSRRILIFIYIFLAVYLLPMFPHGGSANELTRWATAASIVEKQSFEISWTENLIGKNVDTAVINNQTYSNKAPGTAIVAVPFYALTRIFIGEPNASNIRTSWFVMRFFVSTLSLLLLAFWLYKKDADALSLSALLFATPLFVYSLLFFSHVFVAVAVYFAFRFLYDGEKVSPRKCLYAGLLGGLAVVSEFPAVFAIAVFGIGLFFTEKNERAKRLLWFALGGLPFLIFLLIYNNALFGSPFSMSYAHESFPEWAEVAGQGVFGINFPTPQNFFLLLLSPSRGLLFSSPILILAFINFFKSPNRKTLRHKIKITAVVAAIVILCGHGATHGGWAFGARYLIFIIPLLLDSFFSREEIKFPNLWLGFLFTVSLIFCVIPALTFSFSPPEFAFPHNNFWIPFLISENWFTPNLANIFGLSGALTLLPVAVCFIFVFYILARRMAQPQKFAIGIAAAFLLVGAYIFLPNFDDTESELRRATIAERFFKPANRLEKFRASSDLAVRRRANNYEWTIADTRAFAPDDFPYLDTRNLIESPTARMKNVVDLQKAGKTTEAETILQKAKTEFPNLRCEFSSNLAVVYYTTNRKDAALSELENIQPLVNRASRPDCLRSLFLLGSLYQEINRTADAQKTLQEFLANTENTIDAEMKSLRQKIQK